MTGTGRHSRESTPSNEVDLTLSEELLTVGTATVESGRVRAVTHIDDVPYEAAVQRSVEHADLVHTGVAEHDSGEVETLADGSVSIPVFEEQIVVTKRLVVRERVIVRKRTVEAEQIVTADLKRERVEIETTGEVTLNGAG